MEDVGPDVDLACELMVLSLASTLESTWSVMVATISSIWGAAMTWLLLLLLLLTTLRERLLPLVPGEERALARLLPLALETTRPPLAVEAALLRVTGVA
jgi:hypothetical protein